MRFIYVLFYVVYRVYFIFEINLVRKREQFALLIVVLLSCVDLCYVPLSVDVI